MNSPTRAEPALKIDALRDLFGDDNDAIREILETFRVDLSTNFDELSSVAAARDRRRLARIAHSMKGASANVGANGLSALCATVERASAEVQWPDLYALVGRVRDEATEVLECVRFEVERLV